MPFLNRLDRQIHYQVQGEGESLIFAHGLLLGNLAQWLFFPKDCLPKPSRMISFDLIGHGYSSMPKTGYSLFEMSEDVLSLRDQLCPEGFTFVGHSYGALLGLHLALRQVKGLKRLILIEMPLIPGSELEIQDTQAFDRDQLLALLPESLQLQIQKQGQPRWLQKLSRLIKDTDILTTLAQEASPNLSTLKSSKLSIDFIYGQQSPLWEQRIRIESLLPFAKFHSLPGGHYLPTESPQELGKLMQGIFTGSGPLVSCNALTIEGQI